MKKYKVRAKKLEKKLNKKKKKSSREDYAASPSTTTGMGMLTYLIIKKIFWKKDLFFSVD